MGKETTLTWACQPAIADSESAACHRLAETLKLPLVIVELLWKRGIQTAEQAASFLQPQLSHLPSPFAMKGMVEATDLVIEAVTQGLPILIHGDYDADGCTGTAVLAEFFKHLNINVICHQPDRLRDGYGLNKTVLSRLAATHPLPALLITVDCGISSVLEVAHARTLGFKVIVTDHHEAPAQLPAAEVILNPKQPGCTFPFPHLAGVGVAFYLAMGIRSALVERGHWQRETAPNLKKSLDLVALGTVADVVPLVGANRILVQAGLEVMSTRCRPGIQALCEQVGLESASPITAEDIAFRLAPRVNAAGRVSDPGEAVKLFLSANLEEAQPLAVVLEEANQTRKEYEQQAIESAMVDCKAQVEAGRLGLVTYSPDWHPGVVGIVASRIVERFQRPVLVLTQDTTGGSGLIKGSGRSLAGLNLHAILTYCQLQLIAFGGHAMAVGLTLRARDRQSFVKMFDQAVASQWQASLGRRYLLVDQVAKEETIFSESFFAALQQLEPFGEGNPEPIFMLRQQQLSAIRVIREHFSFRLQSQGRSYQGIAFQQADQVALTEEKIALACRIRENRFRGNRQLSAQAVAIFPEVVD